MREELRPKGLLYHYTNVEGFLGIVKSENIRATHIRYLNDVDEFVNALDYLDGCIRQFDPSMRTAAEQFLRSTARVFTHNLGAYVISFTDDAAALGGTDQQPGDRLNLWRAYCSAGRGFSLGFDARAFDEPGRGEIFTRGELSAYLHHCIYESNSKQSVLRGVGEMLAGEFDRVALDVANYMVEQAKMSGASTLKEMLEKWQQENLSYEDILAVCPSALRDRIIASRQKLMLGLILNATSIKNCAFFEEKEWRIVINPSLGPASSNGGEGTSYPRVEFRSGPIGVTPFVEFPLDLRSDRSPLRQIVVGPTPHMDEAMRATKMILQNAGIRPRDKSHPNGVEVIASRIPFRYW
jgi:hypothetical protein